VIKKTEENGYFAHSNSTSLGRVFSIGSKRMRESVSNFRKSFDDSMLMASKMPSVFGPQKRRRSVVGCLRMSRRSCVFASLHADSAGQCSPNRDFISTRATYNPSPLTALWMADMMESGDAWESKEKYKYPSALHTPTTTDCGGGNDDVCSYTFIIAFRSLSDAIRK